MLTARNPHLPLQSEAGVSDSYTSYSHFLFLDTHMVRLPSLCNSTDDLYSPDGLHEELRPKRLSAVEAQALPLWPNSPGTTAACPVPYTVQLPSFCPVHHVSQAGTPSKRSPTNPLSISKHTKQHCSPCVSAWEFVLGLLLAAKGRPKAVGG